MCNVRLIFVCVAIALAAASCEIKDKLNQNDGKLVAYYCFEDTGTEVLDSTSFHNHGTSSGAASGAAGYAGNSFEFAGGTDHVSVPDDDSLDITGNITLDLWVYRTGGSTDVQISGKWEGDQKSYSISLSSGCFTVQFSTDGIVPAFSLSSPAVLSSGGWVHLTALREGDTVKLFENATETASGTFGDDLFSGTSAFIIGGTSSSWEGRIDELRVYSCAVYPDEEKTSPPPQVTGFSAVSKDGAVSLSWNEAAGADGYILYMKDEDTSFDTGLNLAMGTVSYEYTGLTNGMEYTFRITSLVYTDYTDVHLESVPAEAVSVPILLNSSPALNVSGTSTGPGDPYDDAAWSYNLKKASFAWRSVLKDAVDADHQLKVDSSAMPIVVSSDSTTIELQTNTELDPGTHTVDAVIKDTGEGTRTATQNVTSPDLSGEILYYETSGTLSSTWDDFPASVLVFINADGDPVIMNKTTGKNYAAADAGNSVFAGSALKPASFTDNVLTLLSETDPLLTWELDFALNRITKITDQETAPPIDLDSVCAKEVE